MSELAVPIPDPGFSLVAVVTSSPLTFSISLFFLSFVLGGVRLVGGGLLGGAVGSCLTASCPQHKECSALGDAAAAAQSVLMSMVALVLEVLVLRPPAAASHLTCQRSSRSRLAAPQWPPLQGANTPAAAPAGWTRFRTGGLMESGSSPPARYRRPG